jgi:hypothetical protein
LLLCDVVRAATLTTITSAAATDERMGRDTPGG